MPGWTPQWDDVAFDHVAAEQLAHVARQVARRLDADAQVRAHVMQDALSDWEGRLRARLEAPLTEVPHALRELADRLLRLAADVEDAAVTAHLDQQSREDDRAEWLREAERERQQVAP